MQRLIVFALMIILVGLSAAFTAADNPDKKLRRKYAKSSDVWPAPFVSEMVDWKELGPLPNGPLHGLEDSLASLIELGKILFFDPRLSGSGTISCASCHQPELNWTDTLPRSIGHDGQVNKRNAPTIQNSWFYRKLFWDGRSRDLEDQAFAPINSESEMHGDMRSLPFTLRRIKSYPFLFEKAFGSSGIDPDRIATALATFQRSIRSAPSAFDKFVAGDNSALSNDELRGLHIYRTKTGCMNCHHGPLFSDNLFHNNGLSGDDKGLNQITRLELDIGKMKTPSLRDVTKTGPWLHDGRVRDLAEILEHYQKAVPINGLDSLIRPFKLSNRDKADLLAFLNAISAPPLPFQRPALPDFNQ